MAEKTNLGSRPLGASKPTAFQQGSTFLSPGYYDPTAEGTFELQSKLYSDPAAYARYINTFVTGWRNNTAGVPNSNFKNELDYIQFLVRGSGLSSEKGGVSRGILTEKDINGIKTASNIALANGLSFKDVMLSIYQSKQAAGEGGPKYSKQIATSLRLIDLGDAQSKLSTSYYNMFGFYPSEANIKAFKQYWNAETRKQEAPTETSQVTMGGQPVTVGKKKGKGKATETKTVTKGLGFTEEEQKQATARFLGQQFGAVKEGALGGAVKQVYDGIATLYKNNFLPTPTYSSVANIVKDLLTTTDETEYATKLQSYSQGIRDKAAKFFPALAEDLKAGRNVMDTANTYYDHLASKWGTSADMLKRDKEANELIQQALNSKDEKGNVSLMGLNIFNSLAQKSSRWLNGPEGMSTFGNFGDRVISAMGGGR